MGSDAFSALISNVTVHRADWDHIHLTTDQKPRSEDVNKLYPDVKAEKGPEPIHEEVKGYLKMREAKLMQTLWEKEKALQTKVTIS